MSSKASRWLTAFTIATYLFLFAPIVVLIVFSFNDSRRSFTWQGFTLQWYEKLLANTDMLNALKVTMEVAAIAVVAGLIAWIVFDRRQLSRILDDFEAQGISRRSTRTDGDKW